MMQSREVDKYLNKADNVSHMLMNSDDASIIGGRCLHGMHGLGTQLDSDAQRLSSSSPGGNLDNKIRRPSKLCAFDAQGRCKKGRSCISLHEREGLGSAKAGLLAPADSGNHRGFEEGSQVQHVPQFKDSEGLSKDEMYRNLIYAFGKDNQTSAHLAGKHSSPNPGVSQRMPVSIGDSSTEKPTAHANELAQNPVVHEKNNKCFMGHHNGLAAESYLDARGTYPRLDGGNFQFGMDKGSSVSDSHVSNLYQSFGLSISSDPLQLGEKLSAYSGATKTIPNIHQKEHNSFHASYSSHSLTGSRNPCFATSERSFGSPSLLATSHLGIRSHHLFTSDIEKADLHTYLDVGKGCGTSSSGPALLVGSKPEPFIMPVVSPIRDEVWETSVPFVPSFSFPESTTASESQYDPFVDYVEPPKVGNANNLKPSNISSNISSQHTNQYANTPACLIAPDRGRSSSLDDTIKVKACDGKKDAAYNNEKTRDFRFHLAEHIKELVKPIWKKGNLSKDAHRLVVKKSVEKVVDSIEPNQVPTTEELITKYIATCGPKIEKLVKAYVDRHSTSCHPTFKYSSTEMGA